MNAYVKTEKLPCISTAIAHVANKPEQMMLQAKRDTYRRHSRERRSWQLVKSHDWSPIPNIVIFDLSQSTVLITRIFQGIPACVCNLYIESLWPCLCANEKKTLVPLRVEEGPLMHWEVTIHLVESLGHPNDFVEARAFITEQAQTICQATNTMVGLGWKAISVTPNKTSVGAPTEYDNVNLGIVENVHQ